MRVMFFSAIFIAAGSQWLSVAAADEDTTVPVTAVSLSGQRVAEMIQAGFPRGPVPLGQAQRIYDSLQAEAKADPRVEFSFGLVLWRNMKNKEAQAEFQAATSRPGTPFWPAWEALVWTCFVGKDSDTGYARLLEFAKLVRNSQDMDDDARHDEIHWMGRAMAAAELTIDSNMKRELWMLAEKKLIDLFNDDEAQDYNSGKLETGSRHSELEEQIRQSREKTKERDAAKLEKQKERIEQTQESIKSRRESLKKSAEEMKVIFKDQTAAYEKQSARLERDYGLVERNSTRLVTIMASIDQEIALLREIQRFGPRNNTAQAMTRPENVQLAISQLQAQRYTYFADFQRNMALGEQISAKAQNLNGERAEFVAQYESATGENVSEEANMEKWKDRTAKQAESLKKVAATSKNPVPVAKIQAVRTFRTYVDFDPMVERNKVLESYGLLTAGK